MVLSALRRISRRYSNTQVLIRRATSNDAHGPAAVDLQALDGLTYHEASCAEVLCGLERLLLQSDRHWRPKVKCLTILHYLLIRGSPQCIEWLRTRQAILEKLMKYSNTDVRNFDQGKCVREKARVILTLLKDPEGLAQEREKYQRTREELRRSIGRPSSSRRTLELVREQALEDIAGAAAEELSDGKLACGVEYFEDMKMPPPSHTAHYSIATPLEVISEEG